MILGYCFYRLEYFIQNHYTCIAMLVYNNMCAKKEYYRYVCKQLGFSGFFSIYVWYRYCYTAIYLWNCFAYHCENRVSLANINQFFNLSGKISSSPITCYWKRICRISFIFIDNFVVVLATCWYLQFYCNCSLLNC